MTIVWMIVALIVFWAINRAVVWEHEETIKAQAKRIKELERKQLRRG